MQLLSHLEAHIMMALERPSQKFHPEPSFKARTNMFNTHPVKIKIHKNALQSKANLPFVLILLTAVTFTLTL